MSSIIQERPGRRESVLDLGGHMPTVRQTVVRSDLVREIAEQRERLQAHRISALRYLSEHRRTPRWPSGPKLMATLVDEDEWWAKMLGKKRQAA